MTMLATWLGAAEAGLPVALAGVTAAVVALLAAVRPTRTDLVRGVALSGTALVGLSLAQLAGRGDGFGTMPVRMDGLGVWAGLVAVVGAAFAMIATGAHLERFGARPTRVIALLSAALFGATVTAAAHDVVTLIVGLEIVHVAGAASIAGTRLRARTMGGLAHYVVLGGVATAFLVLGAGFAFAATGTLELDALQQHADTGLARLALGALLAGIALRLGAAPFHAWLPDAFAGAPTPSTAFLVMTGLPVSTLALLRIVDTPLATQHGGMIAALLGAMALVSLLIGPLVALVQDDLKRLLAHATVGQIGFVLAAAIAPPSADGPESALLAVTAWALAATGVAFVIVLVGHDREDLDSIDALKGLGREHPWIGAAMTVALLSMVGLPGTLGFVAKLAVLQSCATSGHHLIALTAILSTVITAGFALRIVRDLYLPPPQHQWFNDRDRYGLRLLVALTAAATLILGLAPNLLG